MTSSDRATIALVGAALVISAGVVTARVAVDSRAALHAGWAAEGRGESLEAIRRYLDAARLTLPGSPWVADALARLDGMATRAEGGGDGPLARRALEAMRAALLGSRSFYTPHDDRLTAIDERLARLYATAEQSTVAPGATAAQRVAWHEGRLGRRPGPRLVFAVLALAGLALWMGAALAFVRRGLDRALRLQRQSALAAGLIFAVGLTLFVVGLRLA